MTQPQGGFPPPDPRRDQPAWRPDQPAWQRDQPTWPGGPGSAGPAPVPYHPSAGSPPYQPPGLSPPTGSGPPPPRRRRRRMLLIGAAALVGVLVLSAAGLGAWLLTRDPDRNGADNPAAAVQSFLQAVYRDLDPVAAAAAVCSEARDEAALTTKVEEIRTYRETALHPSFSWNDPSVVERAGQLMVLAVTVTMTTDDEQTSAQTLHVSVLDKDPRGWWVCDLETVDGELPDGPAATPEPSGSPGTGE